MKTGLLRMCWKDIVYVNATFPFGLKLRSAPLTFSVLAGALLWGIQQSGVQWIFHYLDDFITMGVPKSGECERKIMIMHKICQEPGHPVAEEKGEDPATSLQFLDLEVDMETMKIRLPQS